MSVAEETNSHAFNPSRFLPALGFVASICLSKPTDSPMRSAACPIRSPAVSPRISVLTENLLGSRFVKHKPMMRRQPERCRFRSALRTLDRPHPELRSNQSDVVETRRVSLNRSFAQPGGISEQGLEVLHERITVN